MHTSFSFLADISQVLTNITDEQYNWKQQECILNGGVHLRTVWKSEM